MPPPSLLQEILGMRETSEGTAVDEESRSGEDRPLETSNTPVGEQEHIASDAPWAPERQEDDAAAAAADAEGQSTDTKSQIGEAGHKATHPPPTLKRKRGTEDDLLDKIYDLLTSIGARRLAKERIVQAAESVLDQEMVYAQDCVCAGRPRKAFTLFTLNRMRRHVLEHEQKPRRATEEGLGATEQALSRAASLVRKLEFRLYLIHIFDAAEYDRMKAHWQQQREKGLVDWSERLFSDVHCTCGAWDVNVAANTDINLPCQIVQSCDCGSIRKEPREPRSAMGLWMVFAWLSEADLRSKDPLEVQAADIDPLGFAIRAAEVRIAERILEEFHKFRPADFEELKTCWNFQAEEVHLHFQQLHAAEVARYENNLGRPHQIVTPEDMRFGSITCVCGAYQANMDANGMGLYS